MTAWSFEGQQFVPSPNSKDYIIQNPPIKEYLSAEGRENKFFLIGPKGLGKTLLLRYKSYLLLHERQLSAYKSNTSVNELTENLNIHHPDFSKEQLLQFSKHQTWVNIWKFCLTVVILRAYGLSIDSKLENQIGKGKRVSSVLGHLLINRGKLDKLLNYLPSLYDQLEQVQSGVALFIDNVDQQFGDILHRERHYTDYIKDEDQPLAVKVWINAQLGLMKAIYDLHQSNHHVKVFATFRSEAFNSMQDQLKQNYLAYSTELMYSKEQIRKIFEYNIRLMAAEDQFDSNAETFFGRFAGFEKIQHPFVQDEDGELIKEDFFEFLYRHTYGRPREIVRLGGYLLKDVINRTEYKSRTYDDRIQKIRSRVNEIGGDIFEEYQEEIIPEFDIEALNDFLAKINRNVITREEIQFLNKRTANFFYNLGLLGYVGIKDMRRGVSIQNFRKAASYSYNSLTQVPTADYYVVHPTLSEVMSKHHRKDKIFHTENIVGYGLPFNLLGKGETEENFEFAYYVPDLSGKRWDKKSYYFKEDPLGLFFKMFFSTKENVELKNDLAKDFLKNMTALAKSWAVKTTDPMLSLEARKQIVEANNILDKRKNQLKRDYKKSLYKATNEDDLIQFRNVLFGRLITAGSFLFLDIPINCIHHLLIKGKFQDKNVLDDQCNKYLIEAFFLKGFPTKASLRKNLLIDAKYEVYQHLSQFEKHLLGDWKNDFLKELAVNSFLPTDTKDFLEKNISKFDWTEQSD